MPAGPGRQQVVRQVLHRPALKEEAAGKASETLTGPPWVRLAWLLK
jgi:hypothetical protein